MQKKLKSITTGEPTRIITFDILRGFFLFVILIDHLQRFPGFYEIFTGKGYLWASAAEGFFFVSGILIGLLRGRKDRALPILQVTKKVLVRAGTLYLWAVGLTLFFTLCGAIFYTNTGLKPGIDVSRSIIDTILRAATFQYTYGWADFLQYYAVYLAFTPFVIIFLRKNLWWLVLMVSTIVWLLGGKNMFLTWQILFFGGVVVGYYNQVLLQGFRRLSVSTQKIIKYSTVILAVITVIVSALFVFASPHIAVFSIYNNATAFLFVKEQLPPLRLGVFLVWFWALFILAKKYQAQISRTFGVVLLPFGKNSLYVYILQAFILFFLNLFIPPKLGLVANIIINTSVIALIWLAVKQRFLFSIIPR